MEATGNTAAIVRLLTSFVARVVIANPLQVKAIAHARVKTHKVDARILAQLHAAGLLPEVWAADGPNAEPATPRFRARSGGEIDPTGRSRVQAVLHATSSPKYAGTCSAKAAGDG